MKKLISFLLLALVTASLAVTINITPQTTSTYNNNLFTPAPGDTVLLAPGLYSAATGSILGCKYSRAGGTANQRIYIRAAQKGTVTIVPSSGSGEWWHLTHPYFTFENLVIDQSLCIHSFQITNGAAYTIVRNCHFYNLNETPCKVSLSPTIAGNANFLVFENNESERMAGPFNGNNMNGCNIDGSDYHVIRNCYFHDISYKDTATFWNYNGAYGGFIKGGARYCIIENNISKNINGYGLSLGGGTMYLPYMVPDRKPVETFGCILRNNVIVGNADRKGSNHAITVNYGNDNLVYNNTIINSSPMAVLGNWRSRTNADLMGNDQPDTGVVACGVGNVLMNNLSVNIWNMDSLWYEISGGAFASYEATLVQGIQFIKAFSREPMMYFRDIQWAGFNTVVNNLRLDNVNANDIFVDTANNDYRLKKNAITSRGVAVTAANADVQKLGQTFGLNHLDSIVAKGYLDNPVDAGGTARGSTPTFGAYEESDISRVENSGTLRAMIRPIEASVSPNPGGANGVNIEYDVDKDLDHLELTIWDVNGRMVFGVFHGEISKGHHVNHWNGNGNDGSRLPAGPYFLRFRHKTIQFSKTIYLIR
ncbi:MAG: FlgD immunoglobulin-like domain containing protein [Fibrobacterota bacterium]